MLKLSKKIIVPFLSYSIFLRGLFFHAAPCICMTTEELTAKIRPPQKVQFILIGKLDNICIKLVA